MKAFDKPLTAAQERCYLELFHKGDKGAKEILIEKNLRLVAHMVKKYACSEYETEDMLSIGTIGLIKAIDSFDEKKGSRLVTYAAKCIDNAILSRMRLWFQTSIPRAEKNRDGVFWHRYPRICISFALLWTAA